MIKVLRYHVPYKVMQRAFEVIKIEIDIAVELEGHNVTGLKGYNRD